MIRTTFVQENAEDAVATWRETADRLRERLNKEIKRRAKLVKPESAGLLLEKQAVVQDKATGDRSYTPYGMLHHNC